MDTELVKETLEADLCPIISYFLEKGISVPEEAEIFVYDCFESRRGTGRTIKELLSILQSIEPLKEQFPKERFYIYKTERLLKVIENGYKLGGVYEPKNMDSEIQQALDWLNGFDR